MSAKLNRSEVCRVRNLLCQEICWLEHCKACDPENPPEGISKRQAGKNAKAVGYDRSALAAIVSDSEATLEKYRKGPFARRLRISERCCKAENIIRAKVNIAFKEVAGEWMWVKP